MADRSLVQTMLTYRRIGLARAFVATAAVAALMVLAGPAPASEKLWHNARNVSLKVDGKGHAVVGFTSGGRRFHPVVWGAVNARHPSQSGPQVSFKIDYSGGHKRFGYALWRTMRNRCRPYDGPRLPWLVAACKAPDGSYWALQRFQRLLPNLGIAPWTWGGRAWELHISHWTGAPARLDVYADWVMSTRTHEIFGRLTYRGRPVYGFSSTRAGAPLDGYGRLIYLDVYNAADPAYPRGWARENSFLSGRPNGQFCYGFWRRSRYAGYPAGPARGPANGERYRLTAGGPGVTPFVGRIIDGLPHYNPSNPALVRHESEMNAIKSQLFPPERDCFGS